MVGGVEDDPLAVEEAGGSGRVPQLQPQSFPIPRPWQQTGHAKIAQGGIGLHYLGDVAQIGPVKQAHVARIGPVHKIVGQIAQGNGEGEEEVEGEKYKGRSTRYEITQGVSSFVLRPSSFIPPAPQPYQWKRGQQIRRGHGQNGVPKAGGGDAEEAGGDAGQPPEDEEAAGEFEVGGGCAPAPAADERPCGRPEGHRHAHPEENCTKGAENGAVGDVVEVFVVAIGVEHGQGAPDVLAEQGKIPFGRLGDRGGEFGHAGIAAGLAGDADDEGDGHEQGEEQTEGEGS